MTYQELNSLTIEQLRELNSKVVEVIKSKRVTKALEVKDTLYVGAKVNVNHPKLMGKELKLTKINRTKAVVEVINGPSYGRVGSYNVPLSMIQLAA